MKTFHPKLADVQKTRKWYVIDADGVVLGQLATRVADVLRGKHLPTWHPSLDCGDHVIVINAEKVLLTGNKEATKEYIHHTGYPGAIRYVSVPQMRADHPERIVEKAIFGMLTNNRLKKHILSKLYVYGGSEHPHMGQNPVTLKLK